MKRWISFWGIPCAAASGFLHDGTPTSCQRTCRVRGTIKSGQVGFWHIEERKGSIDVQTWMFQWMDYSRCMFAGIWLPGVPLCWRSKPTSILDYVSLDSQSPTLQPSHVPQIQSLSTDATCFVPGSHYPSMSEWLTSWNHRFQSSLNLNDLNLAKVILMQRFNH